MSKQALTLKDAAELVGISEKTLARWIGDGPTQINYLPGTKLVRRADVLAYFQAHYQPPSVGACPEPVTA